MGEWSGMGPFRKLMVPASARRRVTDIRGNFQTAPKWSNMLGMMSTTTVRPREKKKPLEEDGGH